MKALHFLIGLGLLAVSELFGQTAGLPVPTGTYKTATAHFFWEDHTREESWTPEKGDHRKLMVQLYYPSATQSGKLADYGTPGWANKIDSLLKAFRIEVAGLPNQLKGLKTNSFVDGKPAPGRFPVIVLSHAMMTLSRFNYTALSEELASRGYVVATIDHTYNNLTTTFPNGEKHDYAKGWIDLQVPTTPAFKRVFKGQVRVMASDISFVISQLTELNKRKGNFQGKFNLDQIATIGHSMGSEAAAIAARLDIRIDAVCHLDGGSWSELFAFDEPYQTDKPILLLRRENSIPSDSTVLNEYIKQGMILETELDSIGSSQDPWFFNFMKKSWSEVYIGLIRDTPHMAFSDLAFIIPDARMAGNRPKEAFKEISQLIIAFLDQYLRNADQTIDAFQKIRFPELKFYKLHRL